ncbi:MAG TPA: oligosaccharide flippase family protein [Dissulfurispiraceae bacterium]
MSLKRNFIWMLSSKTTLVLAGLFTAALINRSLGPSGRGVFAEIQTWITLFAVLFGLSMDTAIYHFANRELYAYEDKSKFITVCGLSIVLSVIAVSGLNLFAALRQEAFSSKATEYLVLLDCLLISTILATTLTVFFQALGNMKFSACVGMVQALLSSAIIGGAYFAGMVDIRLAILSLTAVQSVTLVVLFGGALKSGFLGGNFSRKLAAELIAAGLKQHVATIAVFIYTRINQLMIFKYCGEAEAGIFAVAQTLAFGFMFFPLTLQTVLYPRVIHSSDDYEVTIRSLRLGFYGWGAGVALITVCAKPLLLLYGGNSFLPSVAMFRTLMVAAWLLPLSSLVAPYCIKVGAFNACSASAVVLGIISMGLNFFLIPAYSGNGAALATALTCVAGFFLSLFLLWYLTRRNPLEFVKLI